MLAEEPARSTHGCGELVDWTNRGKGSREHVCSSAGKQAGLSQHPSLQCATLRETENGTGWRASELRVSHRRGTCADDIAMSVPLRFADGVCVCTGVSLGAPHTRQEGLVGWWLGDAACVSGAWHDAADSLLSDARD